MDSHDSRLGYIKAAAAFINHTLNDRLDNMPDFFSWKHPDGILLPKLFWPNVKKNCSSDLENFLKFKAEGQELAKILRSLEQFIQTVQGQNNLW